MYGCWRVHTKIAQSVSNKQHFVKHLHNRHILYPYCLIVDDNASSGSPAARATSSINNQTQHIPPTDDWLDHSRLHSREDTDPRYYTIRDGSRRRATRAVELPTPHADVHPQNTQQRLQSCRLRPYSLTIYGGYAVFLRGARHFL